MKKILTTLFVIIISVGLSSNTTAQVVQEGDITAGGGLTFTTGVSGASGEIGIGGNGSYSITDEIRAGGEIVYYLGDFGFTVFNIEGHYIFQNEDDLVIYGLAGIGIWRWSAFGLSTSTSGLNLGAGLEYELDSITLFGEAKLSTIGGTPIGLSGGVRFRL